MSVVRSIRLLNAVEAGTVNGSQLEVYLEDLGRESEFNVLLSTRGNSRRMAASPLTMNTIVNSPRAVDIVYQQATADRSNPVQAVVSSSVAVVATSLSRPSLLVLAANPISWNFFNKSIYYEANLRNILANYAVLPIVANQTVTDLITTPLSMGDIVASLYAMRAIVASTFATEVMAGDAAAMAMVCDNADAIRTVAEATAIMYLIAGSNTAMLEIITRAYAVSQMASNAGAIKAIAKVSAAWSLYLGGSYFANNLKLVTSNLVGLVPADYATIDDIIADATALAVVASSIAAVQALASNSAAMTTLATSPNIGIILGSTTAMSVIGPNASAMGSFLNSSGAWEGLFASSVAKGYIVSTTSLVDIVASNSALLAYLGTLASVTQPASVPDGVVGTFQAFDGAQSAKVLIIAVKEVGIAATFSDYQLQGSPQAGSQAGAILHVSSTAWVTHVAGYTDLTWDFKGIGITAATLPIIKYINMI